MHRYSALLCCFCLLAACSGSAPATPSTLDDAAPVEEDTASEPSDAEDETLSDTTVADTGTKPDTKPGMVDTSPPDTGPPGLKSVIAIGAGYNHTCAALADGTVRCTGINDFGQLGDGKTFKVFVPVKALVTSVVSIAGGANHTCVRLTGNTVSCFGANDRGQLGDGTTMNRLAATPVVGLTNVTQIAAGRYHTCALINDGTVKCWGYSFQGQVGDGTTMTRTTPVAVSGLSGVTQISLGSSHSCALLSDKTVKCWGDGMMLGTPSTDAKTPILLPGVTDVRALSAGQTHTCVVVGAPPANKVMCFGSNAFGQLGDDTLDFRTTPVQATGISDVVDLASGSVFTCARLTSGSAKCWGSAQLGAMGDGTFTPVRGAKGSAVPLSNILELEAGGGQVCARLADTAIWCWGDNLNGYLGDGTSISRALPVAMRATP